MKTNKIRSIFAIISKLFQNCAAVMLAITMLGVVAEVRADGLVLWNRLGSASEVLNSNVGPDLEFYTGGDEFSVIATPAYAPGVFGSALTIGPGSYGVFDRVHNVVLADADQVLNPERGTVEAWYQQLNDPIDFQRGIYRIFDGGFGLASGLGLESRVDGLHFNVAFGGTFIDVQRNISAMNDTWIHVAGVWDRAGIGGSSDTVRLYVDGSVVASTTANDWGNTAGTRADIAGANDYDIVGQFYVDNLKVWDYAVTDFSHRFDENWGVPEPGTVGLLSTGGWILCVPRAVRRRLSNQRRHYTTRASTKADC
jgi:hypothetical protein